MKIGLIRALLPLLALAAACEGTSEPGGVEGRYTVQAVNGKRPPVAVRGTAAGGTLQVVDARLDLDPPNAVVELKTRLVAGNGTAGAPATTTYSGAWRASGDIITFELLDASDGGPRVRAEGVVVSPREVAVTLHFAVSSSEGYFTYPVSLILGR